MNCFSLCVPSKKPKLNLSNSSIEKKPTHIRTIRYSNDLSNISNTIKYKPELSSSIQNPNGSMNQKLNLMTTNKINVVRHWEEKDKFRCIFCGGANCKHENFTFHKNPAVRGLHSDFITSDLIASQRPSTILIEKYNLISEFKRINLGLVVNLQREGEHPYCGPNKGLEKDSGFAYHPQSLTCENIRFRPSGWKDMSVPDSVYFVLDIVKDIATTIKDYNKKVLVHCHAGYGRTGVVIACYLIFTTNQSVKDTINLIRKKRPGSVEKSHQYDFCEGFAKFVSKSRLVFGNDKRYLELFMKDQQHILYGEELAKYEHIPKIICVSFERINKLFKDGSIAKREVYKQLDYPDNWTERQEDELFQHKISINKGDWTRIDEESDVGVLAHLIYDWLQNSVCFVINPRTVEYIFEKYCDEISSQSTQEDRRKIVALLREDFKFVEFEVLACIANFLSDLSPDDDIETKEFSNILFRLSSHLMGFQFETQENLKHKLTQTNNLSTVIKILTTICQLDLTDDPSIIYSDFSPYVIRTRLLNGRKNINSNNVSKLYDSITNNKDGKEHDSTQKIRNNEAFFLNVYEKLDGYFKRKDNKRNNKNDTIENIVDVNESLPHNMTNLSKLLATPVESPSAVFQPNLKNRLYSLILTGSLQTPSYDANEGRDNEISFNSVDSNKDLPQVQIDYVDQSVNGEMDNNPQLSTGKESLLKTPSLPNCIILKEKKREETVSK